MLAIVLNPIESIEIVKTVLYKQRMALDLSSVYMRRKYKS